MIQSKRRHALVICILVASATAAQAENHAEKSKLYRIEKRLRIAKDILKLMEESRQLDGEINSMLSTMDDDLEMIIEMGLTQEYAELIANCNPAQDGVLRLLKAYDKKLIKTAQRIKRSWISCSAINAGSANH